MQVVFINSRIYKSSGVEKNVTNLIYNPIVFHFIPEQLKFKSKKMARNYLNFLRIERNNISLFHVKT